MTKRKGPGRPKKATQEEINQITDRVSGVFMHELIMAAYKPDKEYIFELLDRDEDVPVKVQAALLDRLRELLDG